MSRNGAIHLEHTHSCGCAECRYW